MIRDNRRLDTHTPTCPHCGFKDKAHKICSEGITHVECAKCGRPFEVITRYDYLFTHCENCGFKDPEHQSTSEGAINVECAICGTPFEVITKKKILFTTNPISNEQFSSNHRVH